MAVVSRSTHARGVGGTNWRKTSGGLEIFREFQADRRERLIEKLVAKRNAPGEDQTAALCVGAPSKFNFKTVSTRITVDYPDEPEDPPEDITLQTYTAIWWELETVRVENPDDSAQYVNTTRIKQIRYRRPDGSEVQLDNRPAFADFPAS